MGLNNATLEDKISDLKSLKYLRDMLEFWQMFFF